MRRVELHYKKFKKKKKKKQNHYATVKIFKKFLFQLQDSLGKRNE